MNFALFSDMNPNSPSLSKKDHLEFCDLSSDLDRTLRFLAHLSQMASNAPNWEEQSGYGEFLWDYLGKRAALEHVFFDRYLHDIHWDEMKLKAEIWRLRKIHATLKIKRQSGKRSNRVESSQ
jgi:hypothetical protein